MFVASNAYFHVEMIDGIPRYNQMSLIAYIGNVRHCQRDIFRQFPRASEKEGNSHHPTSIRWEAQCTTARAKSEPMRENQSTKLALGLYESAVLVCADCRVR
jgi:hypothetical protein